MVFAVNDVKLLLKKLRMPKSQNERTRFAMLVVGAYLSIRYLRRRTRSEKESKILSKLEAMLQNPEQQEWSKVWWKRVCAVILLLVISNKWSRYEEIIKAKFPTSANLTPPFFPTALKRFIRTVPYASWRVGLFSTFFFFTLGARADIALPYALCYFLPINTFFHACRGRFYNLLFGIFVAIPLMEIFAGADCSNPTNEESKKLNNKISFRAITCLWAPVQYILLFWACWVANPRSSHRYRLTIPQLLGFIFTIGSNTGVLGINISHELIHKNNVVEKTLGKLLLVSCCYGHWYTEHVFGHHRMVSTPDDPATSRLNESYYRFWWRSIRGGLKSAWHLECSRLEKLGYNSPWTPANSILRLHSASALLATTIATLFGRRGLFLFLGQSVVAISLLEVVNYIEHYGLLRQKRDDSSFEPVKVHHSWNADARITNFVLFKLQRHSDHHAHASRRYQILRSFPNAPQMPTGYAGMMEMALIPPIWFKIMNPRVKKISSINNVKN